MVPILQPGNPAYLALVESVLMANGIPYFVHSRHLGGLLPGVQISHYNVCTVMVPPDARDDAVEVLKEMYFAPQSARPRKKPPFLRVGIEYLFAGWFIPG
jgi:hypothetical protein